MTEGEPSMEAHQSFMRRAIELAREAEREGEVPVGALVVLDGSIVGEGYNRPIASNDPSAHAEMVALCEAAQRVGNYRLEGAWLYVTIEPCMMCCGALVHARVSHLVFGAREPRAGAVVSNTKLLQSGLAQSSSRGNRRSACPRVRLPHARFLSRSTSRRV